MRALLSVYDKSGVVELARELSDLGAELVSSGGTAAVLAEAGLRVTDVAELTGFEPILGHRVVTLHPMVHGGILADLSDPSPRADMAAQGIEPFDLVVVGLYPFGTAVADFAHGGSGPEDVIDIGGVKAGPGEEVTAEEEVRRTALDMGLLEEARRNAEQTIQRLLTPLGVAKVEYYPASS